MNRPEFKERDEDYLCLILDYCDRIIERSRTINNLPEFSENDILRDAILMNNVQIGESVNRLSEECMEKLCDTCALYCYDEEWEEWFCDADMDEDDYGRLLTGRGKNCPFYRNGDEYRIARKQ